MARQGLADVVTWQRSLCPNLKLDTTCSTLSCLLFMQCVLCLRMRKVRFFFRAVDFYDRRVNIKFCFKLGKPFIETHEMLKPVYGGRRR